MDHAVLAQLVQCTLELCLTDLGLREPFNEVLFVHEALVVLLLQLLHQRQNHILLISCVAWLTLDSFLLSVQCIARKNSFLADGVADEHLQQMVAHFIELVHSLDVRSHDRFLFLEDADRPIHFHIVQVSTQNNEVRSLG